jgi:ATP-dependent DNA ligase
MCDHETTPPLYKMTAGKKIQTWQAERAGHRYRFVSGQLGGKQTASAWTEARAKNEGRTNATSAEEQALREVNAAVELKLKTGYSRTAYLAREDSRFMPMLAHKYADHTAHVAQAFERGEAVFVQPKLDGSRCVATRHGMMSRKNTPFVSCPHIQEALAPFFEAYPDAILDGELYNHELHDEFEELISLLRKTTKLTPETLKESARLVQYHVYDAAGSWGGRELTLEGFAARHEQYVLALETLGAPCVLPVVAWACMGPAKLDLSYEQYLSSGYEGQMLRLDAPYRPRARSKDLLKRKEFEDAEYAVVDIQVGDGNAADLAARAILRLPGGGNTFASNIKGPRAFRQQLLAEREHYIGGSATVRYANLTAKGVPRFPRIAVSGWHPGGRTD